MSNNTSNRNSIIEEHSKTASASIRKIVVALLITVFGLAFEKNGFVFSSLKLKSAIFLFVLYFGIDMLQYIVSVCKAIYKKKYKSNLIFTFFILKFIPALTGLILILWEIVSR